MALFGFGKKKEETDTGLPPLHTTNTTHRPKELGSGLPPLDTNSQNPFQDTSSGVSTPLSQKTEGNKPFSPLGQESEAQNTTNTSQAPYTQQTPSSTTQIGQENQSVNQTRINPFVTPPASNPQAKQAPEAPTSFDLPDFSEEDIHTQTPSNPLPQTQAPTQSSPGDIFTQEAQSSSVAQNTNGGQGIYETEDFELDEPLPPQVTPQEEQISINQQPLPSVPEKKVIATQEQQASPFDEIQPDNEISENTYQQEYDKPTSPPTENTSNTSNLKDAQEEIRSITQEEEHDDLTPIFDDKKQEEVEQRPILEEAEEDRYEEEIQPVEQRVILPSKSGTLDIFVEKKAYQGALLSLAEIESDISKASDHLTRVIDDENIVSAKLTEWHDLMDTIQGKLIAVDTKMFDKGETL